MTTAAEPLLNPLRRKPNIILVGELRDADTVSEAIKASEQGHALYTTVHRPKPKPSLDGE